MLYSSLDSMLVVAGNNCKLLLCILYVWTQSAAFSDDKTRAKTAPTAHQRRRQWQAASIEVKTDAGSNIRIKAPGRPLHC